MKMKTKLCIVLAVIAMLASASVPPLDRQYANELFSIDYPSTWQVLVDEEDETTGNVLVAIGAKPKNDYDFAQNINILAGSNSESVSAIADATIEQVRQYMGNCTFVNRVDNFVLTKTKGCKMEYMVNMPNGATLRYVQYILKSADIAFVITETWDNDYYLEQKQLSDEIVKTFRIKRSWTETIGNIFR